MLRWRSGGRRLRSKNRTSPMLSDDDLALAKEVLKGKPAGRYMVRELFGEVGEDWALVGVAVSEHSSRSMATTRGC